MTTTPKGSWPFAPSDAPEPTAEELAAQHLAEQQKLIEVLKFTPRTYTIQIWGYGGEYVMGTVDRKIYDYFKQRRLSVSDYAWDSDYAEENDIPEDMEPFPPGSWYECDDMGHVSGVDRNAGTLQICDENGNTVYEISLEDIDGYSDGSPEISGGDEVWIDSKDPGTIVFVGVSNEKGTFFEGEIELTQPFDSSKLCISYDEIDGNEIVSMVTYDSDDIDNNGGSSNGKSSNFGFYVAGSQKDGKWERYKDMDDIVYELTEWFPSTVNPVRDGKYEAEIETGHTYQVLWTGDNWVNEWNNEQVVVKQWRGIAENPDV
jgi:hypothetical protein